MHKHFFIYFLTNFLNDLLTCHLSDIFLVKNGPKQGDAFSP